MEEKLQIIGFPFLNFAVDLPLYGRDKVKLPLLLYSGGRHKVSL